MLRVERLENRRLPSTLTVTSLADDNGSGTLRSVLAAAASGDTVVFAPELTNGTITLTSSLTVTKSVTINGPANATITVSGNDANAVFVIGAGNTDGFSNLTISHGNAAQGGGIQNAGTLSLTNCTLSQNTAVSPTMAQGAGIYNTGSLTLTNCLVTSNTATSTGSFGTTASGGGIFSTGALSVNHSTISGNHVNGIIFESGASGSGGGIVSNGGLVVLDSIVTGNDARFGQGAAGGGGLVCNGRNVDMVIRSTVSGNSAVSANFVASGGGILSTGTGLTLTNSTVTGNTAQSFNSTGTGGGIQASVVGPLTLNNDTVAGNLAKGFTAAIGGGIAVTSGTASLQNTIVATNALMGTGSAGPDLNGDFFTASSNNLIGDGTGSTGLTNGQNGNQVGPIDGQPIDPRLGTLQNNGGPNPTEALLAGSPAIDRGAFNFLSDGTDQRGSGFNRIINNTTDIGAYEYQPPATQTTLSNGTGAPVQPGQTVTFTVTVAGMAPGSNTPQGTVSLLEGGNMIAADQTLSGGMATFMVSFNTLGAHSIAARYNGFTQGDYTFSTSPSLPVTQLVQDPTHTTLTSSLSETQEIKTGRPFTLTATVVVDPPGSGSPTGGTVTFLAGNTILADNVPLVSGVATTQVRNLAPGRYSVRARYNGTDQFSTSTSPARTQVVRSGALFAVGGDGHVQVLRTDNGGLLDDFMPYGAGYTAGINVAVGDITGDGFEELVTAAAAGNPHVKVYDGAAIANGTFLPANPDASLLTQLFPYALQFNVGANVAVADVTGDGFGDLITGATVGNPHVKVYSGQDIAKGTFNLDGASLVASFFAYGLQFNIGATVAAGDLKGDGYADIVTGATAGNPHVKAYSGKAIATGSFDTNNPDASLLSQLFPFQLQFNVGANVAVGDVNGDGSADLITGSTIGNPEVKVYDGQSVVQGTLNPDTAEAHKLDDFFAFALGSNLGASVAAADFGAPGGAYDILVGEAGGPGAFRVIRHPASGVQPPAVFEGALPDFPDGIAVGA